MVRTLLAACAVYCYAHPLFDGLRPATLERPLQFFYVQVNEAASQGRGLLTRFDEARIRAYAQTYMKRVDAQLKQAKGSGALAVP
jgi:hypothetical protein